MNVAEGASALRSVLKDSAGNFGKSFGAFFDASWGSAKSLGKDLMENKFSSQLFKHVALGSAIGAGVGLGASAIGRGLNTTFPDIGFQTDNIGTSAFKGAIVGGGIATGLGALLHSRGAFAAAKFLGEGKIAMPINMAGKTLGSKFGVGMLAGGAAIGGSGMLLNSIISTSMTKAQEPSGSLGLPPGAAVYDDALIGAMRFVRR